MKKKNILFIHHSPSKNTKKLSKLVENKIGTSIAVCHLGITLLESDSIHFTHAHIGDQVVTVRLIEYLDYISAHMPHVAGARFERLVNKHFVTPG
mgnify:CR=1 FL=1